MTPSLHLLFTNSPTHVIAKERSDCGNLNPHAQKTAYLLDCRIRHKISQLVKNKLAITGQLL